MALIDRTRDKFFGLARERWLDKKVYEKGTTITCVTEENHPEGLVSPDAFNDKSCYSVRWITDKGLSMMLGSFFV